MTAEAREWVLAEAASLTTPEPDGKQDANGAIWTGRRRLTGNQDRADRPPRDAINEAIDALVDAGELIYWHGLVAPATDDHLRAVIENERLADLPRRILIGRANVLLDAGGDTA